MHVRRAYSAPKIRRRSRASGAGVMGLRLPHALLLLLLLLAAAALVDAWKEAGVGLVRLLARHGRWQRRRHSMIPLAMTASVSRPGDKTVLVVGSGGREFAIAEALLKGGGRGGGEGDEVGRVYMAPGNVGTAQIPRVENRPELKPTDAAAIARFAREHGVDLVVVGPEDPLVKGLADDLAKEGVPCFGPTAAAARLEGSKAWSKAFMARHGIPTAAFATFTDLEAARAHVMTHPLPVVVKASGLAAGKGVTVAQTREEALAALDAIMRDKVFGEAAGAEVVVEECLQGEEVSMMGLSDGARVVALPCARDYKRLRDWDAGPNTGGMGSIAPVPGLSPGDVEAMRSVLQRAVEGMAAEGHPYRGALYGGFMLTPGQGPKVLEFNCRFGDPETQSILPLLPSAGYPSLYTLLAQCARGQLAPEVAEAAAAAAAEPVRSYAATIIAASEGYPTATGPVEPRVIRGLEAAAATPGVTSVVHAGTKRQQQEQDGESIVTAGGRVLGVTGAGPTLRSALFRAYAGMGHVRFPGRQCRADIGARAVAAAGGDSGPVRLAILGSTRGTSVQPLLAHGGRDPQGLFEVVAVLSDKDGAGILERARQAGVPEVRCCGGGGADTEAAVEAALAETGAEILLLNGYSRILSPRLVSLLRGRCLNVHPSLLPDFGGLFDLAVHQAVLDAGRTETGCTVHFVTDQVDQGPALVRLTCPVDPAADTAEAVKARVQALESRAWVEALRAYRDDLARVARVLLDWEEGKEDG